MLKQFIPAARLFMVLTLLTGVFYPLVVLIFAQTFHHEKANGSLLRDEKQVIGSHLIAQKFTQAKYFWPRPSAVDYNALSSGGSNLSMIAAKLKVNMATERARFSGGDAPGDVPLDLLTSSASGLDPEISPASAYFQIDRVAKTRGLSNEKMQEVVALIKRETENRQIGFIGEPRVNVLELNRALDQIAK